jgi:proline dehydrogenase
MNSFENTQVAFPEKSTKELQRAYWLFKMVKNPFLVKMGSSVLTLATRLHLPLKWALKKTVFKHFCGGETLEESQYAIKQLGRYNIKAVLDYAAEGVENEKEFELARERIIATIELGKKNPDIGFAVFKFTGIARFKLLEKVSSQSQLSREEKLEYQRVQQRALSICEKAYQSGVPVMIDAEETWIQDAIDTMVEEFMEKYNKNAPVVYHTLQMYRIDKLYYLKQLAKTAKRKKYIPAFKLVRGAYMEKERERALKMNYASPIHPDKNATDTAYNDAVKFCIENIDSVAVCIGTHNEESCLEATFLMEKQQLNNNHNRIYFSQLKGMSDHISYNLAAEGYNVSKYVPYGPLRLVMPYLLRRAQENTSVAGQTGRELYLLRKEINRRKSEKN